MDVGCPHVSFEHRDVRPGAPRRESIEVRALVYTFPPEDRGTKARLLHLIQQSFRNPSTDSAPLGASSNVAEVPRQLPIMHAIRTEG